MLPDIGKSLCNVCSVVLKCTSFQHAFQANSLNGRLQLANRTAHGLASMTRSFSVLQTCGRSRVPPSNMRSMGTGQSGPQPIGLLTVKNSEGKKIDSPHVVERFRRLGNGMWLSRVPGYDFQIWKKIMKKGGPQKVYRMRRHVICSSKDAKILDKLVTGDFKRQRWTVSDPYAGYDESAKFYYNPFSVPGANAGRGSERREYMWNRFNDSLKLKDQNRRKHRGREGKSNRQKPLLSKPYFH